MALLVDTSVWSLALRREGDDGPYTRALRAALDGAEIVVTGMVLQEILQGINGPKKRDLLIRRLTALPWVHPDKHDHIAAADLHTTCRRAGVQLGPIDALIAQLCLRHSLTLLSSDKDFVHAARHCPLKLAL